MKPVSERWTQLKQTIALGTEITNILSVLKRKVFHWHGKFPDLSKTKEAACFLRRETVLMTLLFSPFHIKEKQKEKKTNYLLSPYYETNFNAAI